MQPLAATKPGCLSENDVLALLRGTLVDPAAAQAHIDECEACQELFACIGSGERPKPADARPERVGRYRILETVGSGAMGIVYLAEDPALGRRVALKMLRHQEGEDRLAREAQALARVAHPNVIVVYEVGTFESQMYMAMEFVDGESLTSWLAKERSIQEILGVFEQAGRGLAVAHAAGLVHRDFKPDNVLVGRDGRVRVVDFGLARQGAATAMPIVSREDGDAFRTLTRTGAFMGTPAYMAPEQYEGIAADERSDQFSFAVSLYEALYKKRPFHAETITGLILAVKRGATAPPRDGRVPKHVEAAVMRALSVRREERFVDMTALLAALAPEPDAKSRRPLFVTLAAIVVIATGLGVASRLTTAPKPSPVTVVPETAVTPAESPPPPAPLLKESAVVVATASAPAPKRVDDKKPARTNYKPVASAAPVSPLMPTTP